MAIADDMLVVGGGIAAYTVAPSAVETGVHVRLLTHKEGTLRQTSGLVDVFGYAGGDDPLSDPCADFDTLPEGRPYHIIDKDGARAGFCIFDEVVGDAYCSGHADSNALVMIYDGAVKSTARYPASVAPDLANSSGGTLLVGFAGLTDFDAPVAADHPAAAGVLFLARGIVVGFPRRFHANAKVIRFAKALDRDEDVDSGTVRFALVNITTEELDGKSCIGFPVMLDDDHDEDVRVKLSDRPGVPVFEVPTGSPSLFGLKLKDILFDTLDEASVHTSTGNPAVDLEANTGRVETVAVDQKSRPTPCSADQVVLATGGLVNKGLDSGRESATKPVFGCHVPHPEDRYDWSDPEVLGNHTFARLSIILDNELQPINGDGESHFENLHVAGGVVGGTDMAREKSVNDVSLVTGAVAGRPTGEEIIR